MPAKKSTEALARGVVIRETPEMPLTKTKEKVDVTRDNENELDFNHETDESESRSESDNEENKEDEDDEEEVKNEFVKTPLNDSDDKVEGDEDEEMDYTTSQLYNDVDIRLNEPVDTVKGFLQEEGTNVAITNVQQGNTNPEILQVIEDAHVTLSTVSQKTNVLVTSSSHSSDLVANFLNFLDITHTDVEIVSPFDVHFHHEILPKEVSNFASPVIQSMFTESLEQAILDKESSQLQSSYEAAATLTEFELKKILIDKMDKSESYMAAPQQRECYEGLKNSYNLDKTIFSTYDSYMPQDQEENPGNDDEEPKEKPSKTFNELMNTPIDFSAFIMNGLNINNLTQETLSGPGFRFFKGTRSNYVELEYDFEECYKALSEKLDWENPKGSDYPFDITKPLPLVMSGNHQKVPVDYFFNNDLKYLQRGVLTMTYTMFITKIKDAQYDLPSIEDMVLNI
nr:hypothetical protein [Tanacetum cinerariifolium]